MQRKHLDSSTIHRLIKERDRRVRQTGNKELLDFSNTVIGSLCFINSVTDISFENSLIETVVFNDMVGSSLNFKNCKIKKLELSNYFINDACFDNCVIGETRISNTRIEDSSFKNCEFEKSNYTNVALKDCDFEEASMNKASFWESVIESCSFTNAKWKDIFFALTHFGYCNFNSVKDVHTINVYKLTFYKTSFRYYVINDIPIIKVNNNWIKVGKHSLYIGPDANYELHSTQATLNELFKIFEDPSDNLLLYALLNNLGARHILKA